MKESCARSGGRGKGKRYMEALDMGTISLLLGAGFFSAFIDSAVGGGGLISLPAMMLAGLPPVFALGSNKAASIMGSFTSSLSFFRSGKIDFSVVRYLFPLSFLGSALGVYTVRLVPPDFLKPMVVVLLILVTAYSLLKKNWGEAAKRAPLSQKRRWIAMGLAFFFGFYDGFFGPGTGSFLLFGFLCLGFDFVGAAANARVLNFGSNISAALFFFYFGYVDFAYALPMGGGMILGALCGTHMAIRKGTRYVKPLFISMTALLIGKQLWDLLR